MTSPWKSRFGGRSWRIGPQGVETRDRGLLRTSGHPKTVIGIWEDFGEDILRASFLLDAPVDMIVAMIPIEAVRLSNGRFNPRSNRFEPGYISDEETPHRRSPGLMQTLISTAKQMATKYDLMPKEEVTTELLYDPSYSILLGGAYIAHQIDRYGPDPVLICGAYNAGSVRQTDKSPWKIRAYSPTRIDRYVAWYNDFTFAWQNELISLPSNTLVSVPLS